MGNQVLFWLKHLGNQVDNSGQQKTRQTLQLAGCCQAFKAWDLVPMAGFEFFVVFDFYRLIF
jgi:hypothetical protein